MKRKFFKAILILVLVFPGMLLTQSKEGGSIMREEPLTREKSLVVSIRYGNGYIDLKKAESNKLFSGEFFYKKNRPDVQYELVGEKGKLDIRFSGESDSDRDERDSRHINSLDEMYDNEMNLAFSDKIPIEFQFDLGVIKGDVDFSGLKVENVDMEVGVSKTAIIFKQPNPIFMESFSLEGGVGKIQIEKLGNANLKDFSFEGGIGSYELDFSGNYQRDLHGSIEIGMGKITLYMPRNIGVRLAVEKSFLSSFQVDEVYREGDVYTNDQWGKSSYSIDLDIETGVGKIDVIWVD